MVETEKIPCRLKQRLQDVFDLGMFFDVVSFC